MAATKKKPTTKKHDNGSGGDLTAAEVRALLYEQKVDGEPVELGDGQKLWVTGLSGEARGRQLQTATDKPEGERRPSVFETYVHFWIECVYTPDGKVRVFADEDPEVVAAHLADMPYGDLEKVAFAAQRLSGATPEAVDEAGKDS